MFFRKKPSNLGPIDFIICGLGNPGTRYENTRHNCGFMVIDDLAKRYDIDVRRLRFKSLTGEVVIGRRRCFLMKPTTYMNLSGEAVVEAMHFYKIPPEKTLVICDDVNLDVGTIRIREKGSDGGQNGLKNIIMLSSSDKFPRVRVGIGKKPHPDYDLAKWVTSLFLKSESDALEFALSNAVAAIERIVEDDIIKSMNEFNGKKYEKA